MNTRARWPVALAVLVLGAGPHAAQPQPPVAGERVAMVLTEALCFFEPPGSEHLVSENASATEPASLLAVFVADDSATATMIAAKPSCLGHAEAAAAPVVTVTALQMLFDHARIAPGQVVLIHGAAGSVGACAVQPAREAGVRVIATALSKDVAYVRRLGAAEVIDVGQRAFEHAVFRVDAVLDTLGGAVQ